MKQFKLAILFLILPHLGLINSGTMPKFTVEKEVKVTQSVESRFDELEKEFNDSLNSLEKDSVRSCISVLEKLEAVATFALKQYFLTGVVIFVQKFVTLYNKKSEAFRNVENFTLRPEEPGGVIPDIIKKSCLLSVLCHSNAKPKLKDLLGNDTAYLIFLIKTSEKKIELNNAKWKGKYVLIQDRFRIDDHLEAFRRGEPCTKLPEVIEKHENFEKESFKQLLLDMKNCLLIIEKYLNVANALYLNNKICKLELEAVKKYCSASKEKIEAIKAEMILKKYEDSLQLGSNINHYKKQYNAFQKTF